MGKPSDHYPWHWSVYSWIAGQAVAETEHLDKNILAKELAEFLLELHGIDTINAPMAGEHNFYQGGDLSVYDDEVKKAIDMLGEKIDQEKATQIWKKAVSTQWGREPILVHGDMSVGNLLVENSQL